MKHQLDVEKYKQYFHYGLQYNQDELLDAIIISTSKDVHKLNFERIDFGMNRLQYTIDAIKRIYVQFERFINLAEGNNPNWYTSVNKDTVNDVVMDRVWFLHNTRLAYLIDRDWFYGIYPTDRGMSAAYGGITGMQRYGNLPSWMKDDVVPILRYLAELEEVNPYQYESLFMDTKYARCVNSGQWGNSEKVKTMYGMFQEKARVPKRDLAAVLGQNISFNDMQYIDLNYSDYWTITDLQEKAKTDSYRQKLYQHCDQIRNRDESYR